MKKYEENANYLLKGIKMAPAPFLELLLLNLAKVVPDHLLDSLLDRPLGLPLESLLGSGGVRSSALRVVDGHLLVDNVDTLGEGVALFLLDRFNNVLEPERQRWLQARTGWSWVSRAADSP